MHVLKNMLENKGKLDWNLEDVFIVCRHVYVLMQCNLSRDFTIYVMQSGWLVGWWIRFYMPKNANVMTKREKKYVKETTRGSEAR